MKTGLYFGSFNPIHIGHMAIAGHMLEHSDLEELWFVVSPHNPLKDKESLLEDFHRVAMVREAIGDEARLRVSDIESRLPTPSYTIDTLTCLHEKHPEREFSLVMGSDQLPNFHKWKNATLISRNYHRLVYPRPGFIAADMEAVPNATLVDAPLMDISSSQIRRAIAEGHEVRHLMPPAAWTYLRKMHFYE